MFGGMEWWAAALPFALYPSLHRPLAKPQASLSYGPKHTNQQTHLKVPPRGLFWLVWRAAAIPFALYPSCLSPLARKTY